MLNTTKKEKPKTFYELLSEAPVGVRLRTARQLRGWSVAKLSEESGVSKTTIQNAEQSKSISSNCLINISRAVGLSLDDLVVVSHID
jgi:transcriptional regulator with XRE-family HTH domain